MMEGFADLLSDAFSESSVPSFSTGDLDFENLGFDEESEEEQTESLLAESSEAQLQEASAESAALLGPTADALNAHEEQVDEENDEEEITGVHFGSETSEDDDCSSSDEEQNLFCSGRDDEEEEAESPEEEDDALTMNENGIQDEEDSEILEDADEVSVRLQEEVDSDEEEDGRGNEENMKSVESEEEKQEDSSESDYEGIKTEENFVSGETEKPHTADPADSGLEFPSISFQNLQDLICEVDGEVYEEKMSDFTGEEHQEAGESFADYPSDFSSGEYGRNPVSAEGASEGRLERAATESLWTHRSEEAEDFLMSTDIEMTTANMMSLDEDETKSQSLLGVTSFDVEEKTSESDSCSSSDDEEAPRRSGLVFSENSRTQFHEDDAELENIKLHGGSGSGHIGHDQHDPAEFLGSGLNVLETNTFLSEYLLAADDTDGTESLPSDTNQCPNSYSVVQREDANPASPFVQGSIDDSFFFNREPNPFSEDGQEEEEDEYQERRNFEQMKQRIEAFKKFYDNSNDESGREERQTKVQFCADPLSQVNYYETDCDRDSISSSSDREEDPSSTEGSDDEDQRPAERSHEEDSRPAERCYDEDLRSLKRPDEREEVLIPAEQYDDDEEEDPSSPEQSDEPKEFEEDLNIKPLSDPSVAEQHQSPSDITDTQTCTETRKSLSSLKLVLTLSVLTAAGLMMFSLTTDQPDWLRQFLFF